MPFSRTKPVPVIFLTLLMLLFAHTAFAQTGDTGTATIGYWMNHADMWTLTELQIGDATLTQDDALALLRTPSRGDKAIDMSKQLIGTKLNLAGGNEASCVEDVVVSADNWLKANPTDARFDEDGSTIHTTLDEYNNGLLCASHRDSVAEVEVEVEKEEEKEAVEVIVKEEEEPIEVETEREVIVEEEKEAEKEVVEVIVKEEEPIEVETEREVVVEEKKETVVIQPEVVTEREVVSEVEREASKTTTSGASSVPTAVGMGEVSAETSPTVLLILIPILFAAAIITRKAVAA